MRHSTALLSAVLAAATLVVVAPAASASRSVPLPAYGDITVDDAHQRVFISGGTSSNGVVVTDFSGRVVKTITNQWGATGLELSTDGSRLFVALAAGDAVSAIDTATLTEAARYPTGAGSCPTHLARTGDLVWFGYGCDGSFTGKIGRLDPAATEPVTGNLQGDDISFQRAPLLTATGTTGGRLVAGQLALSLSTVRTYTVTADNALTANATGDVVGAGLVDLDVTTDGSAFYSAAGSRDRVESFIPADLARNGAYSTRPRPNAVALSPDNRYVAAGALTADAKDVLIYQVGAATPTETIALDSGDTVAPRGLAWSADLRRLFVITQHDNQPQPNLEVVSSPLR